MKTGPSVTIKKKVGCGAVYTTIVYTTKGVFDYILVTNDGDDRCGRAITESLARTLTFSIRRAKDKTELKSIVKNLKFQRCNNIIANKEHITSCADAISRVIEKVVVNDEGKEEAVREFERKEKEADAT